MLISLPDYHSKVVITDGFHHSKPLQVEHHPLQNHYFTIECAVDDAQLIIGLVILFIIYATGLTSGILFLKMFSFLPVIYFLFLYYINRKAFLRISG
jgi:hypothetical protein